MLCITRPPCEFRTLRARCSAGTGREGGQGGPGGAFQAIGRRLQEARTSAQQALGEAQKVLTPEQWQKVPEQTRKPNGGFRQGGPGGGTRGGSGVRQ